MSESSAFAPENVISLVITDRLDLRRASLHRALREGDVTGAARALSRLRVKGATIDPAAFAAAHGTRADLGRAIRGARERRAAADAGDASPAFEGTGAVSVASAVALASLPEAARAWRVAGVAMALAAVLIALLPAARVFAPTSAVLLRLEGSPAPIASGSAGSPSGGRGRTEVTIPLITPAPVAVPTSAAAPTATALAVPISPAPTASPSPSPRTAPLPVALPSPSPLPSSTPPASLLPPPLASGFSRIRVLVIDATTLSPIPGACIVIGAPDCGPTRPHTNALGLWWVDFPTGSIAGGQFPVTIQKDGYQSLSVVVATTGNDQDFPAPLTPLR